MSATTLEADGGVDALGGVGVDDPRKPLLGTTGTGVYKLQTKNRILNDDGSYNATTISESTSPSNREGNEPELELEEDEDEEEAQENTMENISRKSQWILLAVASGACAAFNGVFAKL